MSELVEDIEAQMMAAHVDVDKGYAGGKGTDLTPLSIKRDLQLLGEVGEPPSKRKNRGALTVSFTWVPNGARQAYMAANASQTIGSLFSAPDAAPEEVAPELTEEQVMEQEMQRRMTVMEQEMEQAMPKQHRPPAKLDPPAVSHMQMGQDEFTSETGEWAKRTNRVKLEDIDATSSPLETTLYDDVRIMI
jgi:hypothetical protein